MLFPLEILIKFFLNNRYNLQKFEVCLLSTLADNFWENVGWI